MKKILAAVTLLLALVISHTACHAADEEDAPTQPTFVPSRPQAPAPDRDLSDLMKMLTGGEDDVKKVPALVCTSKPCVFGYRLFDSIDDEAATKLGAFLEAAAAAKADTVMIEIHTGGGSLDAAHEISRSIENAPLTVACIVDGHAYSAGMYILQSCDVRVMTKRSSLMIHQAALMVRQGARLTQQSMDQLKVHITIATRGYVEWCAHRMKVSVADVLKRIDNGGEWYMSWDEALKVGAVDKVVSDPPEAYFAQLKHGLR